MHKLGFKEVNNDLFAEYSWYFRNALVRANYEDLSKGIHKTEKYLIRFLLNLLLQENYPLKNREMHTHYVAENINDNPKRKSSEKKEQSSQNEVVRKGGQKRWSEILELIKENPRITRKELTEKIGINPSAIQKHIKKLKTTGTIERVGGDKGGHWKIIEK